MVREQRWPRGVESEDQRCNKLGSLKMEDQRNDGSIAFKGVWITTDKDRTLGRTRVLWR